MDLHLVRHGETDWNRDGRIQGWIDVGLNDTGRRQARRAAGSLPEDKSFHLVSSPLRRARETADILAEQLPVEADCSRPEFKELNQGYWNGLKGSWLLENDSGRYEQWLEAPTATHPPGGESLEDVRDRVQTGLDFLRETVESPCLLVAHKVVNSMILTLESDGSLESVLDTLASNAEVQQVSL